MKIALLRVGADSGNLGFHSPIFEDETFDFIPIDETYNDRNTEQITEHRTYSNTKIKTKNFLIDYFKENSKNKFKNSIIHFDPEFDTFTYGDPNFNKNGLKRFTKGDYLIFYSSLQSFPTNSNNEISLYVIGYFEIETVAVANELNQYESLKEIFNNNFHVKHWNIFKRDVTTLKNRGLKLIKGTKNSKLLKKAYKISEKIPYGSDNQKRFVISQEMQKIFGDFGGKICIQRNSLRVIEDPEQIEKTISWLRQLV